jgi:hypothetical protein
MTTRDDRLPLTVNREKEPSGSSFNYSYNRPQLFGVPGKIHHNGGMPEYLIRTATTHELPAFPPGPLADVLVPAGFACEQADGWGDFRMRCGATQIAFSAEDPGWQVIIDGPMPGTDRERLVTAIARQIAEAAGQPCEWLQIA